MRIPNNNSIRLFPLVKGRSHNWIYVLQDNVKNQSTKVTKGFSYAFHLLEVGWSPAQSYHRPSVRQLHPPCISCATFVLRDKMHILLKTLSGWWFQPFWNIWKSIFDTVIIPHMWKNKIHVAVSSSQLSIHHVFGECHRSPRNFKSFGAPIVVDVGAWGVIGSKRLFVVTWRCTVNNINVHGQSLIDSPLAGCSYVFSM